MSNRLLLFLTLAHAISQRRGGMHVAILGSAWSATAIGVASTGATGPGTAIVNLLQNVQTRMDSCDLYVTYTPTDADLGMARICRVRAVYRWDGTNVQRYKPGDPVTHAGFTSSIPIAAEIKPLRFAPLHGGTPVPANPATGAAAWDAALGTRGGTAWYPADPEKALTTSAVAPVHTAVAAPVLAPVPAAGKPVLAAPHDPTRESLFMTIAYSLLDATWTRVHGTEGNKVACILVDPGDRIVSWGINMATGMGNPTWHGETVTLRRHLAAVGARTLERGYKVYTTLKPCYMCAGFIAEVAPRGMTVVFGQDDPQITNSTLDRNPVLFRQSATGILRTGTESFPQALHRLMTAAGGTQAIPYLEAMPGPDRGSTFARTLPWSIRMDRALRSQHGIARDLDTLARTEGHRSRLVGLDLAVPSTRQSHDHLWVLNQGLALLKAVGAPVVFR